MAISDSFGPVATNQDGSVLSWKWEESSDNSNWQDVGTILTNISGQLTNTLTVQRATVAMHGTYVRCEAKTSEQTAYSSSAQVLIEGQ